MKKKLALFAASVAALVLAPIAAAHVTVNPNAVAANSFARFDVRVPNELDNASTTKVSLRLPASLQFVAFQPKPGWKRTVTRSGDRITAVTWTSAGAKIGPGEFDEFGMSARVPAKQGTVLTFPAVQTYSNGKVVRWIGPESADTPAPRVTLTAAVKGHD
jgi:uncharacterized protein YcnI